MAVPIITSHSDFTLYTSQLQRLDVEVDTEQVELKIFHQARIYYSGDGRTEIFSSTYFARNGQLIMIFMDLQTFILITHINKEQRLS